MKRMLLMWLMVMLSVGNVMSQTIPKVVTDEVDVFTNIRKVCTNTIKLYGKPASGCTMHIDGNDIYLHVRVYNIKDFLQDEEMPYKMLIKDKDGELISLEGAAIDTFERVSTHNIHWGCGIVTGGQKKKIELSLTFPLSAELVKILSEYKTRYIRFEVGRNTFDYTIDEYDLYYLHGLFEVTIPYLPTIED